MPGRTGIRGAGAPVNRQFRRGPSSDRQRAAGEGGERRPDEPANEDEQPVTRDVASPAGGAALEWVGVRRGVSQE